MIANDSLIGRPLYFPQDTGSLNSGVPHMKLQQRIRNRRREAFTLMEVLVVVAILVVLAGIGIVVFRYLSESKEKIAKMGIKNLEVAVTAYKLSHGDFPESLELLIQPGEGKAAYTTPEKLIDPWERPYQYDLNQRNPRTGEPLIYSLGEVPGTSKPIRSWEAQ
jgi:general secretion pathway protein G